MKEENDIPRTAFKSEMIEPEGQIDLEADAKLASTFCSCEVDSMLTWSLQYLQLVGKLLACDGSDWEGLLRFATRVQGVWGRIVGAPYAEDSRALVTASGALPVRW